MEAEGAEVGAWANDPFSGSTSRKAEADAEISLCGGTASAVLWEARMVQASKHAGVSARHSSGPCMAVIEQKILTALSSICRRTRVS